jgi:hypothetical protein
MNTQHGSGKPLHHGGNNVTALSEAEATAADETAVDDAEARKGGAPTRGYVVLEQIELDDGVTAYQNVLTVEARNGQNALRKAFKDLREGRPDLDAATLAVIPEGQWKPTPVRAQRKESITVSVGD